VAGAAIIFPLLFLGLMSYKLYLYLSMHMNDEIVMEIAVILCFVNAIVIELIIYDFARYRKLKRKGKWVPRDERKEKKEKKNRWIYLVPIVFGAFGGLCAYVFMKDKKLGERLFQFGMLQTIALMVGIFMIAVIFG
jgi:phosphate/sulfate permease